MGTRVQAKQPAFVSFISETIAATPPIASTNIFGPLFILTCFYQWRCAGISPKTGASVQEEMAGIGAWMAAMENWRTAVVEKPMRTTKDMKILGWMLHWMASSWAILRACCK